jgi:hypothetical protein
MRRVAGIVGAIMLLASVTNAATIVIVNGDGSNEGFNDPTPVSPVGGNSGTTLGQQRLNVFQHAADIWGALLPSSVTILVSARFDALSCNASGGVLGSAGPVSVFRNFPNAPVSNTWYHGALADRLAGVNLSSGQSDITARFNSSIDNNNNCLQNRNWYYGLDGNEGGDVELLPVVLHELGHGLGFSSLVDLTDGAELLGTPDIYERFIRDNTLDTTWDNMTGSQRATSATNDGNVVWDGRNAQIAAVSFLSNEPIMLVNSPPSLVGRYALGTASFGPALTETGITGDVVLVDDGVGFASDACGPITNIAEVSGNIALVDRGSCTFTSKALAAQAAGAIAVIIANNVAGDTPIGLGGAPSALALGSSISHWDVSATPSLLMEPSATSGLSDDVDLTLFHFEDIGWLDLATDTAALPSATRLHANVPNPFNPSTRIGFSLASRSDVRLEIYDIAGRLVKRLLQAELPGGDHAVQWNGRDDGGNEVASGVYFYRFVAGDFESSQRMVLLR